MQKRAGQGVRPACIEDGNLNMAAREAARFSPAARAPSIARGPEASSVALDASGKCPPIGTDVVRGTGCQARPGGRQGDDGRHSQVALDA